ncbi:MULTISPECIES: hypothetical protein [unclassified Streptomyces]|uniref:hypothetical protein n=1 Tax=unclassified Streptomyces TaxID=2593676 RepID=UPI003D7488DE
MAQTVRPRPPGFARAFPWTRGDDVRTAAVACAFAAAQLLLVPPAMGLGWDESVYVSQVGDQAPAAFFSAPRARGVPVLVAPIASWSSSTPLLRVYLAVLSAVALFLALRAWRGLFPARVVAGGGALFASLWVTVYYGPQAMPNIWVALGALAAVGCFLRFQRDPVLRGPVWGLGVSAVLMALMRPGDAAYVGLALLVALVTVRRWRSVRLSAALLGGLAAGAAPWLIEAYAAYGGPLRRLAEASRIQGGLSWHLAVDDQMRSLSGRTLCRPCEGPMPDTPVMLWWFVLPALALLALVIAVRRDRAAPTVLSTACAATVAVPYLFLIGYAAPRFLLPAYALLALPAADALGYLLTRARAARRPLVVTAVAVGLAGHLAVQSAVLWRTAERTTAEHERWARVAADLHRHGVRPPCVLTGHSSLAPTVPIAYYTGCASAHTRGHDTNTTTAALARTARRVPVVFLTRGARTPPGYAHDWDAVRLEGGLSAYLTVPAPTGTALAGDGR